MAEDEKGLTIESDGTTQGTKVLFGGEEMKNVNVLSINFNLRDGRSHSFADVDLGFLGLGKLIMHDLPVDMVYDLLEESIARLHKHATVYTESWLKKVIGKYESPVSQSD